MYAYKYDFTDPGPRVSKTVVPVPGTAVYMKFIRWLLHTILIPLVAARRCFHAVVSQSPPA
jgi:hypothetical protein